jgi:hypothetical protein
MGNQYNKQKPYKVYKRIDQNLRKFLPLHIKSTITPLRNNTFNVLFSPYQLEIIFNDTFTTIRQTENEDIVDTVYIVFVSLENMVDEVVKYILKFYDKYIKMLQIWYTQSSSTNIKSSNNLTHIPYYKFTRSCHGNNTKSHNYSQNTKSNDYSQGICD